jgi:hypothetical protein
MALLADPAEECDDGFVGLVAVPHNFAGPIGTEQARFVEYVAVTPVGVDAGHRVAETTLGDQVWTDVGEVRHTYPRPSMKNWTTPP